MNPTRCFMSGLLICVSLAASNYAIAEELAIDDQFNLAVGAYFITRTGGQIRVDQTSGPIGLGTSIDWEQDLLPTFCGFQQSDPEK